MSSQLLWWDWVNLRRLNANMSSVGCCGVQTPIGNTFLMYRLGVITILKGAWLNMKCAACLLPLISSAGRQHLTTLGLWDM